MNKIFELLGLGNVGSQKKKKLVVISILVTSALIVALLAAFVIVQIASRPQGDPVDSDGDGEGDNSGYISVSVPASNVGMGDLLLVNKSNHYKFSESQLVEIPTSGNKYGLRTSGMRADKVALEALNKMMDALYKNVTDANIVVTTVYRSSEAQTALNSSTPAGASDFHTGRLFELKDGENYAGVDAVEKYEWLYKNAHKYGFIVRYPADTEDKAYSEKTGVGDFAYAFRYVGVAHATYMYNNKLCLEEYIELLRSSYEYGTAELTVKAGSADYVIYYVRSAGEATNIQVPEKYKYEISGNNIDGYIVTVNRSARAN